MSSILELSLSFVHVPTQRTGYVIDGPFGEYDREGPRDESGRKRYKENTVFYACKWDDTGEEGEVLVHEMEWIPATKRHITDGVRACWCNPMEVDGVVIHNTEETQLN